MKTLKLTDAEFMALKNIALVLRLRGLDGHQLLANITAEKRYKAVLSRTITQEAEVTFSAQNDQDAEAQLDTWMAMPDELQWTVLEEPSRVRLVTLSEIPTKHAPDPKPEHDDPTAPGFWPKLRETWEVVNPPGSFPEQDLRGVVVGVDHRKDSNELVIAVMRPNGSVFYWIDDAQFFDFEMYESDDWKRTHFYRKVLDAP